jgi:hypothetical protein
LEKFAGLQSFINRLWLLIRKSASKVYNFLVGAWTFWEKTGDRAVKITKAISLALTGMAVIIFVIYSIGFERTPKNCMNSEIGLRQLESCVFDSNDFYSSSEFMSFHKGHRLTFAPSNITNFSSDQQGSKSSYFAVGHWGPTQAFGTRSVILCHKAITDSKPDVEYLRSAMTIHTETKIVVTGVIEKLSRDGMSLDDCYVLKQR